MSAISKYNDGYKFLLTCIDVFSKIRVGDSVEKINRLKASSRHSNFYSAIGDPLIYKPTKETEFVNAPTRELFKENRINFYTTENDDVKASVVERFNRTLKSKNVEIFHVQRNS